MSDDEEESASDDGIPVDRQSLRVFAAATRASAETNLAVARHDERIEMLEEEVKKLRRVVIEGNGRSHATRLELVESALSDRREVAAADATGRWQARAAIVTGIFGLLGGLAGIVALLLK